MSEKQGLDSAPPTYAQTSGNQGYQPVPQGAYPPQAGYPPQTAYPPPGSYPQGQQQYPPGQPGGYPPPGAVVVTTQPYQPTTTTVGGGPHPPDYMVCSVLACLCCFWPTGLCAIYYACRRNTLLGEGDSYEANRMAVNARNLIIVSVVLGIIWIALAIILRVVVYSSAASHSYY